VTDFLSHLKELFWMILGVENRRPSYLKIKEVVSDDKYSHALLNNIIPTISLAVPRLLKNGKIKTLMWTHNTRLLCANGLLFNGKSVCNKCLTKGSHWAFFQNCHRNLIQSFLYSVVYRFQRVSKNVFPFISEFICNSEFAADQLKL